jgi:hypothetical protein
MEAMVNEDGDITVERLRKEVERRESLEYIRDAAEAFLPALESLQSVIESRGKSIQDIASIVHLPSGSDRVSRILQAAIEQMNESVLESGEVIYDRFTHELRLDGEFSTDGVSVIIDDSMHTGSSVVAASKCLEALGVAVDQQIALVLADDSEGIEMKDMPIPCIALQGSETGRWSNRFIEGLDMPEFWPKDRSKAGGEMRPRDLSVEERDLIDRYQATDDAIGEEVAKQFLTLNSK